MLELTLFQKFQTSCRKATFNRLYHCHAVIRVMTSLRPQLNSSREVRKCTGAKADFNLALLQVRSTPVGISLISPPTMLLKGSVRCLKQRPINSNSYEECNNALLKIQGIMVKMPSRGIIKIIMNYFP